MKDAKIDCTDKMIEKIMKKDDDAQKLMHLPMWAESIAMLESTVEEPTAKFQKEMMQLNKEKNDTITYCKEVVKKAEI